MSRAYHKSTFIGTDNPSSQHREHENEQFGARDASRSYTIGVDGGGSKTLAVVVDAHGFQGRVQSQVRPHQQAA
jgi:hypothetical protein